MDKRLDCELNFVVAHADARVFDGDCDCLGGSSCTDLDRAAVPIEFYRVSENIEQYLLKQSPIAFNLDSGNIATN